MLLKDQVILITGAGGGLGGTAALALAKQGAHIILLDKSIPKMEKVYDAIVGQGGPEPVMYPFDLAGANEAQYFELAEVIDKQYGSLQGLLHSAVELSAYSPVCNIKTQEWGHSLNVNLNAPFLLTRVLLPVLQKSEHASVVFTSDSSARKAPAYSGAYGVAKIALEGFAKILAEELEAGQKIRVNTLVPGPVDSPLRKKVYPAEDKTRLPAMDSLDAVYVYLFSNDSLEISGQTIDAQTFTTR
ncbi:SDR family NAD(P)-dependent oxidoreductase [Methylomarinum vadi]|uniref:SDR family NAD(P)-dependent oxidoreductase n=1 Tax=Methylomarinum vadi TaxID=438855 RepID=UPI0004DFC1E3|nr:SDR family NAD(P)-dependent oxidoreductase [Methylomarinum vadi]